MNKSRPLAAAAPYAAESRAALLALVASGVVWGLSWLPLKYFAGLGLDGHLIGLTAYALVAVVSLPVIWRERHQWRAERNLLLLIALFLGCANLAFTVALMSGSVVRAMLLFFLLPAWGALGGALFLQERVGPARLLAVLLSLAGVVIIVGGVEVLRQPLSLADAAALLAGICYTAAGITNRKARVIPLASRTLVAFVGSAVMAIIGLALSIPTIPTLSAMTWVWLALFAFLWLLGGTILTTFGVTRVQASRAAVIQVVELMVSVLTAIWLGGESLDVTQATGAGLIVAAVLIEACTQSTA